MAVEKYRKIIQDIIKKYAEYGDQNSKIETQVIFDIKLDHYLMFHIGWQGERRVYGSVIHIDIKDHKIWIQRDGIEGGIAQALIDAGVPQSDIVLGYRSPYMRQFTNLAKT